MSELLFTDISIVAILQSESEQDYLFQIFFSSAKCLTEHMDKGAGDDFIYHGTTEFYGLHNQHKLELNAEQKQLFNCEKERETQQRKQMEQAKVMYKNGLSIEQIALFTALTTAVLQDILD